MCRDIDGLYAAMLPSRAGTRDPTSRTAAAEKHHYLSWCIQCEMATAAGGGGSDVNLRRLWASDDSHVERARGEQRFLLDTRPFYAQNLARALAKRARATCTADGSPLLACFPQSSDWPGSTRQLWP